MSLNHLSGLLGRVIAASYRVERMLGAGGTSVVFAATHIKQRSPVAIKCMLPQFMDKPTVVRRFIQEARIGLKLRSRHTARIMAVGRCENDMPYIVMERLEGIDLLSLLQKYGQVDPRHAADYIVQACIALAEAHAFGIVHRDIKPGNLFLARMPDGRHLIKVLDFGIAKWQSLNGIDHPDIDRDDIVGTLPYMSPEQVASPAHVDTRSDIWSLGATLYRLMTGQPPLVTCARTYLTLSMLGPPGLDLVIQRCLQPKPEDRFATVTELASALRPFISGTSLQITNLPEPKLSADEVTRQQGSSRPPAPTSG